MNRQRSATRIRLAKAVVSGVHVIDDSRAGHHQDEVLAEEIQHSLRHIVVGDPDGGVFGDGEFAVEDCDVDIRQRVRRIDSGSVDVRRADAGDERGNFLCLKAAAISAIDR